ncbi:MAG: PD40 domain-containing protein, partial [Bacteroidetes bacterium]|nr:PD40 domain-containing protein [Bacteroidota bacterium]
MRTVIAFGGILAVIFACAVPLHSQDMFPAKRVTSDSTRDGFPSWSPDGKTVIYSFYNRVDGKDVHGSRKIPSDGGIAETFTEYPTEHPQWSPDGR